MRRKNLTTLIVMILVAGAFLYAASGKMFVRYSYTPEPQPVEAKATAPSSQQSNNPDKRMVDMTADDSYLIEKGDSTIFILVGNFAAHHNGAVILADSAVRYSNQSFVCFGNVLINQNSTYIYGERAEYNRNNNTAKVYSKLVKVVDEDAVMYTYQCNFNTAKSLGEFGGGCYVEKEDNILEAEKGFYDTKTHELKAIHRVQMRNNDYEILSDSVIFNTQTEDAQYFTNTHIWNKNDEYLNTQAGTYTKESDLHNLTRRSYLLQPEREIWSDSIMYYRTDGHIIARRNIQMDDTTQKILGFADYAEWWDEPGNAFFTRRPSMINYDPELSDSIYISADTLWLYTIAVKPPKVEPRDTTTNSAASAEPRAEHGDKKPEAKEEAKTEAKEEAKVDTKSDAKGGAEGALRREAEKNEGKDNSTKRGEQPLRGRSSGESKRNDGEMSTPASESNERMERREKQPNIDSLKQTVRDSIVGDTLPTNDTIVVADSTVIDTTKYTPKQLRRRAKFERKAAREAVKARERRVRDSLDSLEQIKLDSIQHIRDSLLKMKIDTIIAERIERSSRLADEEKERVERMRIKAEQKRRQKIDKAKARAIKRGKVYTGEDYDPDDTTFMNIDIPERPKRADSTAMERGGESDSIQSDSTLRDTLPVEVPFPEDSTYKMIKAYRNVKMFRSESQMACDSLTILNTDSIIRMYKSPVMWNDNNQILSDSAMIHTERQRIKKAHFYGTPIMGIEIDTAYYNQVKGKEMISFFDNGKVYRNDVNGNAQTIYYLQEEEDSEVSALMYIESSAITFYLNDGSIEKISYKQNPEYVLYPMEMVPESQERKLQGFDWQEEKRPTRVIICDRRIVRSNRERAAAIRRPTFPIMERIDYDRRRLVENKMWEDRTDRLSPDVIDWRNSRESYKKRKR